MKQRIILAVMAAFIMLPCAQAQKIHKIMFGDTIDANIGKSVVVDMERANNEFDAIGAYLNYEVVNYIYVGNDCSKENLELVLNSLAVGNNDIIIFYYSGHGGHANGGFEDKWPQMCLNRMPYPDYWVPVRKVIETIRSKRPHFALVLTDCCNNIDESGLVSVKGFLKSAESPTTIEERVKRNYQELFTKYSGVVAMTSSKLTQTSAGNDKLGGLFSYMFFDDLYEALNSSSPTWKEIADAAKANTLEVSRNKQEPYYDLSMLHQSDSQTPAVSNSTSPVQPTSTPPAATTSQLDKAIAQLLADPDHDSRLSKINSVLNSCFSSPSIYVVSMGRNLTTTVGYETARAFLRRLALSNSVVRINIIKESKGPDGKCSLLTIHEIRK